jgi:hypothetical protein
MIFSENEAHAGDKFLAGLFAAATWFGEAFTQGRKMLAAIS